MLSGDTIDVIADDSQIMETTAVRATAVAGAVAGPTVTIVATDGRAHETDLDRGVFTVSRTGSTNKALNIVFTIRGSAKNGIDYKKIAKSVLIPAGKSSVTIKINPIDDDRVEIPETITLVLNPNENYVIDGEGTAKVGLRNNDGAKIKIAATDTTASETNNDRAVFKVSRTGSTAEPLVVRITVYGRATNGVDFERVISQVVIPAGRAAANVAVKPINDVHNERNESVYVQLRQGRYVVTEQNKASMLIGDNDAVSTEGFITFVAPDGTSGSGGGHVFHTPAGIGGVPTDLTRALNQINGKTGSDASIAASPDGQWIVLHTNRFDTDGDDFDLAVYPINNLGAGKLVTFDDGPAQPLGRSVVANGGNLIVFESADGPHETDLWAAVRSAGSWSKVLLTADSTHAVNTSPSLSDDGTNILFTGGDGTARAVLQVKTDGTDLETIIDESDAPEGSTPGAAVGPADYGPGGSIVFQAGWTGNQIWRVSPGAAPHLVSGATNETSPSVLSDGRIVTLWGDRPSNEDHVLELTIRYADGGLLATLLPGVDLPEGGIGCAG